MNRAPDSELIRQAARGSREAFFELYERYSVRVHGLSLAMLRNPMAAEDVTQESFLKLWRYADRYNPARGSFLTWLLTITRRVALDRIRSENRRPDLAAAEDPETILRVIPNPESESDEARWGSLRFALSDLPSEQLQVLKLAFYFGLSHTQIAEFINIPLGTVKTRIRLGMDKLKRIWVLERDEGHTSESE